MPTYEYECNKGHQFEVVQRISEEPLRTCKVCRSRARRLISATNFILKGSGWYSDGYSSSNGKDNGKSSSETSSSAGDSASSSSSGDSSKGSKTPSSSSGSKSSESS